MPEIIPQNVISRLQWSRRGITAYDENGSFVFRLEGWMCPMFTAGIVATLGRIEQERVRRSTYKSEGEADATREEQIESSGLGEHPQGDAGWQAAEAGGGNRAGRSETSGVEAEEAVGGVPV